MKKTLPTSTIHVPTVPGDLPEGWAIACLGEISSARLGKTPRREDYRNEGIHRIIKFRDVTNGAVDFGTSKAGYVVDTPAALNGLRSLAVGDVLVTASAHSGDQIGKKCAHVSELPAVAGDIFFVGELLAITAALGINRKWPYLWFHSDAGMSTIQAAVFGVHLTAGRAQTIEVPLAPSAEQDRIVAKAEKLLSRVDAVNNSLSTVSEILKTFRQSVLAAACSGRLTQDWRERHPKVEPARVRLQKVLQERNHSKGSQRRHQAHAGAQVTPIFSSELRPVDISGLPEIPNSWAWAYLPNLGFMNRGTSRHRPRNAPHLYGGAYPFIQTGDVARSGGRIVSHQQTYAEAGLAQSRLWPAGTVCVTIAANIADSALLTYPACFPDSIVGIIADPELSLSEYLEYFIRTARGDLAQFAPATAQANINIAILNDVAVPTPPLEEQREIIRRVDALFALGEKFEGHVAMATKRTHKLSQAILAKSFRGELVPTEAELARQEGRDYEPASVLLERIRATREKTFASRHRSGDRNGKRTRVRT